MIISSLTFTLALALRRKRTDINSRLYMPTGCHFLSNHVLSDSSGLAASYQQDGTDAAGVQLQLKPPGKLYHMDDTGRGSRSSHASVHIRTLHLGPTSGLQGWNRQIYTKLDHNLETNEIRFLISIQGPHLDRLDDGFVDSAASREPRQLIQFSMAMVVLVDTIEAVANNGTRILIVSCSATPDSSFCDRRVQRLRNPEFQVPACFSPR